MVEFDKEKEERIIKKAQELVKEGWNAVQIGRYFGIDVEWIDAHVVFPAPKKPKKPGWFGDALDEDDTPKKKKWTK